MPSITLIPDETLPEPNFRISSFGRGFGNLNNMPILVGRESLCESNDKSYMIESLKILIEELNKGSEGVFSDECMIAFDFSWSKCKDSLESLLGTFSSWQHSGVVRHDVYLLSQELRDEVAQANKRFSNEEFHELALVYAKRVVNATSKYVITSLPESLNTYPKFFGGTTRSTFVSDAHSLLLHLLAGYDVEWN
ncbi:hypothetical protein [Vibrio sp. D431a]|uniref:hypothetical protein n=1 Tax=Vibrio sp. D431a TaxID=2837388 RepID=UPI002556D132|nr:hypothetical protein [Vibrio sp. D431a]MDK9790138.1 hypothetical protein [Vibrio sp. D431a]